VLILTRSQRNGADRKGLSKRYIASSIEDSLKRLKTDYIDLYQSHRDDSSTPIQETLEAYAALIKAGKVRAIGASNFTRARMQESLEVARAHGLPRYESLQPNTICTTAPSSAGVHGFCVSENIGVIPYYALAKRVLDREISRPRGLQ